MATEDRYNGWTNYATWRVNLELIDDYAGSLLIDLENGDIEGFAGLAGLAEAFKDFADEALTGFGCGPTDGIALDYARAFVDEVNWDEIARHWEELIRPDPEDDDPRDEPAT